MTLFLIFAAVLVAATLATLVVRGPVAEHVTDPETAARVATRPSRALAIGLGALLLAVAGGGYALVGAPGLLAVSPDAPAGPGDSAEAQVAEMQRRAERRATDATAWYQAGRAQMETGHADRGAADYRRALALRPDSADLLADLADALAVGTDGRLDGEPIALVDRALALDPDHVKALALKGSQQMREHDFRAALTNWDHALRVAQPGDPIAAFLRQQLDAMRAAAAQHRAASAP